MSEVKTQKRIDELAYIITVMILTVLLISFGYWLGKPDKETVSVPIMTHEEQIEMLREGHFEE